MTNSSAKKKNNELCWYFNTKSGCKKGRRCKYQHIPKTPSFARMCSSMSSGSSEFIPKAENITGIFRTPVFSNRKIDTIESSPISDEISDISPPSSPIMTSTRSESKSASNSSSKRSTRGNCRIPKTLCLSLFAMILVWSLVLIPVVSWNSKALEIVTDFKNEVGKIYSSTKDFAQDAISGVSDTVVMLFEKSGKFAFKISSDVDKYFNDIEIKSVRDTWVTRVSEGIEIEKGLFYVETKRSQPDRYPKQFVDDLEGVIRDLQEANVKKDFFEYKEVGFKNNELRGHVGVIAVRRYAWKKEFDIAFSITSTDVTLELKNCVRNYFGFGNCQVDISSRQVRSKLVKYFQKELILELKNDYPGKIEVIWDDSEPRTPEMQLSD